MATAHSRASVPIQLGSGKRREHQGAASRAAWVSDSLPSTRQARRASTSSTRAAEEATQNVVVLGGSYGGMHAASVLAAKLPPTHRVILIERNSHFNHLYVFPRFSVLPGHEHKAFIPYTSIFSDAADRGSKRQKRRKVSAPDAAAHAKPSDKLAAVRKGLLEFAPTSAGSTRPPSPSAAGTSSSSPPGSALSSLSSSADGSSSRASSATRSAFSAGSTAATSLQSHTDEPVSREAIEDRMQEDIKHLQLAKAEQEDATHQRDTFISVRDLGAEAQGGSDATLVQELEKGDGMQHAGPVATEDAEGDEEEGAAGSPHLVLQATVTEITESHVIVAPARAGDPSFDELKGRGKGAGKKLWSIDSVSMPYSHLIYALGSHLPDPLRTEARTKQEGMGWMRRIQARVAESNEIVLVGGGALGVEFATDIASVYPTLREGEADGSVDEHGKRKKKVTLIHSRKQLLPNFDERVHEHALSRLQELGVRVVLGERLALTQGCPKGSKVSVEGQVEPLPADAEAQGAKVLTDTAGHSISAAEHERKIIRTTGGKVFTADLLLLCTGQQPNSGLMARLSPSSVDPKTRLVRVLPTLQVAVPDPRDAAQMPFDMRPPCGDCDCFLDRKTAGAEEKLDPHELRHHVEGLRNVYAIGDVADAFGAINAGYQAWSMADVAAENILRDIGASKPDPSERSNRSQQRKDADLSDGDDSSAQVELQEFDPAPTMLKLSLGLGKMVFQGGPVADEAHPDQPPKPEVTLKDDPHDLAVEGVWKFMAKAPTDDLYR